MLDSLTDNADDMVEGVVTHDSNSTLGSIKIGWNEPKDPNGVIVKFQMEYRRTDIPNVIIVHLNYLQGIIVIE